MVRSSIVYDVLSTCTLDPRYSVACKSNKCSDTTVLVILYYSILWSTPVQLYYPYIQVKLVTKIPAAIEIPEYDGGTCTLLVWFSICILRGSTS